MADNHKNPKVPAPCGPAVRAARPASSPLRTLSDTGGAVARVRRLALMLGLFCVTMAQPGVAGLRYEPGEGAADAEAAPDTGADSAAAAGAAERSPAAPESPAQQRPQAVPGSVAGAKAPPAPAMRLAGDSMDLRWEKTVGGDRTDEFNAVVSRRADLVSVAVGSTMSRSSGRRDAWVVAIDSSGNTLWERSLGGARDDEAHAVVDLDNGGVVVAGTTSSRGEGGSAGLVARFDADGTLIWEQIVDTPGLDVLYAVTVLASGDILVGGTADRRAGLLARLDDTGRPLWQRSYGADAPDTIHALVALPNDDIIAVGAKTELFDSDGFLARLSAGGEPLWHLPVGSDGNDRLVDAVALAGGDVLAVGESEGDSMDGWVLRVSPDAELRWQKRLGAQGRDSLYSVQLLADQTLVAAGIEDESSQSQPNSWILRLTESGDVLRSRKLGAEYLDGLRGLSPRSDGSFVAVGFNQGWHSEPSKGYVAMLGSPLVRSVTPRFESNNPPVVFMPGEGKIFTEQATVEVLGNVIHDRPVPRLFVDGRPARVLHNGAFTTRISVPLGTTDVRVEAMDDRGAVGSTVVQVTRVEAGKLNPSDLAPLMDNIAFGTYHAVVIGNNRYGGDIPALATAEKDARVIASVLEADYGFNVELLLNADRATILEVLERKSGELREDDNLLLYYAGHGYYDEDVDLGYWLPVDADLESKRNWIRNSTITDTIKGMQAKHVLLVADSCFSGTLLRSVDVKRTGRFYEQMARRSARLVMTSGGIEPVMDGGGDGHSVFARSFIEKLRGGERIVDGTSLFQAIREPVVMSSEQVPQYSNIRFIDSDGGDFLFVRRAADQG